MQQQQSTQVYFPMTGPTMAQPLLPNESSCSTQASDFSFAGRGKGADIELQPLLSPLSSPFPVIQVPHAWQTLAPGMIMVSASLKETLTQNFVTATIDQYRGNPANEKLGEKGTTAVTPGANCEKVEDDDAIDKIEKKIKERRRKQCTYRRCVCPCVISWFPPIVMDALDAIEQADCNGPRHLRTTRSPVGRCFRLTLTLIVSYVLLALAIVACFFLYSFLQANASVLLNLNFLWSSTKT